MTIIIIYPDTVAGIVRKAIECTGSIAGNKYVTAVIQTELRIGKIGLPSHSGCISTTYRI